MADMILELKGEHFKRQYLLYIIEIIHQNDNIYYIGHTGDHNYVTALPAFRRLAAHLEDMGGSTQNQIYRHLAVEELHFPEGAKKNSSFTEEIKQAVEKYLVESVVRMYVYSLQDFQPEISPEQHLEIVRKVTLFEKQIIQIFLKNSKKIANKMIPKSIRETTYAYPQVLNKIVHDFGLTL